MDESFGQAFSKACAVEAAEASSRSAEREILFSAFLFANFFFAPQVSKKKWVIGFVHDQKLCSFGLQPQSPSERELSRLAVTEGAGEYHGVLFFKSALPPLRRLLSTRREAGGIKRLKICSCC